MAKYFLMTDVNQQILECYRLYKLRIASISLSTFSLFVAQLVQIRTAV